MNRYWRVSGLPHMFASNRSKLAELFIGVELKEWEEEERKMVDPISKTSLIY